MVKTISSGKKTGGDFLSACVSRMGDWLFCLAEDHVTPPSPAAPAPLSTSPLVAATALLPSAAPAPAPAPRDMVWCSTHTRH